MNSVAANPPAALRSYVFPDGSSIVRARQLAWTPWLVPGIDFKLLDIDRSFDKTTLLIAAPQSATLPAFRQSGAVEMYIEDGQMSFERGVMVKGDYVYLPGGASNGPFKLAAATKVYLIMHGPLRMGSQFIDSDSMMQALEGQPAGEHMRALLAAA